MHNYKLSGFEGMRCMQHTAVAVGALIVRNYNQIILRGTAPHCIGAITTVHRENFLTPRVWSIHRACYRYDAQQRLLCQ